MTLAVYLAPHKPTDEGPRWFIAPALAQLHAQGATAEAERIGPFYGSVRDAEKALAKIPAT